MPKYRLSGPDGKMYDVTTPGPVSNDELINTLSQGVPAFAQARQAQPTMANMPSVLTGEIKADPGRDFFRDVTTESGIRGNQGPFGIPYGNKVTGALAWPFVAVGEAVTRGQEAYTGKPRERGVGMPYTRPGGAPALNAGDFAQQAAQMAPLGKVFSWAKNLGRAEKAVPAAEVPASSPLKMLTRGTGETVGSPWASPEGDFAGQTAASQIEEELRGLTARLGVLRGPKGKGGLKDPIQGDTVSAGTLRDRIAETLVRVDRLQAKDRGALESAKTPRGEAPPVTTGEPQLTIPPRTIQAAGARGGLPTNPENTRTMPGNNTGRTMRHGGPPERPIGGGSDAPEAAAAAAQAVQNTPPATRSFADAVGYFSSTVLGRLERIGPEGVEVARRIQQTLSEASRWYAANISPLLRELSVLNPAQRKLFFEVADRGGIPGDPAVAQALAAYKRVFGPTGIIPTEAGQLGVMTRHGREVRPFEALENFFPHEWAPDVKAQMFAKGSKAAGRAAQQLVDSGQARSLAEAQTILRRYSNADRKVGGLEFGRDLNLPGYIEDPLQAVSLRGWKVAQRFAELRNYGANAEQVQALIRQMETAGNLSGAKRVHALFDLATHPDPVEGSLRWLADKVMTFEAITKLPLASVVNLTQPFWVALRTDFRTAAQAMLKLAVNPAESREATRQLGLLTDISTKQFMAELAARGGIRSELAKATLSPYLLTERFVRTVGGNAGKLWVQKLQGRIAAGENSEWMARELGKLLLSPDEIAGVFRTRAFTPDQTARMAWAVADQVMFMPSTARRSEFLNTTLGAMVGQFKGFAINLSRLLHQEVIKEAKAGNYKPVAKLLAMLPLGVLVGEAAADVRTAITGGYRSTKLTNRILDNLMSLGGLGLATDFVRSLARDGVVGGAASFVMGPGLSDAVQAGTNAAQAMAGLFQGDEAQIEQNLIDLGRQALGSVPLAGPSLRHATSPSAKEYRRRNWSLADRLGFTDESAKLEQYEEMRGRRSRARQWQRGKQRMGW